MVLHLLLWSALGWARPPAACPVHNPVISHFLYDFPELGHIPLLKNPKDVVRTGDVLVSVLDRSNIDRPAALDFALSHKPHVAIVGIHQGKKVHFNSPALLGSHTWDEFELLGPYVILRPKWEGHFPSYEAFETAMNRNLGAILRAGIEYDPWMNPDVLTNPAFREQLCAKLEKGEALKKGEVPPQYCAELALTALAAVRLPLPKGVPAETILADAVRYVRSHRAPEGQEAQIKKTAEEIIEFYLEAPQAELETLKKQQKASAKKSPDVRRSLEEKIKVLEAQIARFGALRGELLDILDRQLAGKPLTLVQTALLKTEVVRPQDFLLSAMEGNFEVVGLFANKLPTECLPHPLYDELPPPPEAQEHQD